MKMVLTDTGLNIFWRPRRKCAYPLRGNRKGKPERGVTLEMSKEIMSETETHQSFIREVPSEVKTVTFYKPLFINHSRWSLPRHVVHCRYYYSEVVTMGTWFVKSRINGVELEIRAGSKPKSELKRMCFSFNWDLCSYLDRGARVSNLQTLLRRC